MVEEASHGRPEFCSRFHLPDPRAVGMRRVTTEEYGLQGLQWKDVTMYDAACGAAVSGSISMQVVTLLRSLVSELQTLKSFPLGENHDCSPRRRLSAAAGI